MTYPQPVPVTAKTTLIKDWLVTLPWDTTPETGYPFVSGPEILTSPDRLVTITPAPGPGWVTEEGAADTWSFQVRLRGPADDPDSPALFMQRLDTLILNSGNGRLTIDGVRILAVSRAGSTPSPLPANPEDRRFEYTCTYLITTALE